MEALRKFSEDSTPQQFNLDLRQDLRNYPSNRGNSASAHAGLRGGIAPTKLYI
jgi:hypothetical protein